MFPPKAENFEDLTLKMIILLREIVSESFEKPKIFRLWRAKSVKELKNSLKAPQARKFWGSKTSDKKAPPYCGAKFIRGGLS